VPPSQPLDWLLRSRETDRITLVQLPNLALGLFVLLRVTEALLRRGTVHDLLHWLGTGALVWWAIDEVLHGVNPVRRLVGVAVLAFLLH
jgi:hypothetical protein